MDVRVGLWRRLSTKELMRLNCGVGEDSWESLGLQEDPPIHSDGDQPWDFFRRNDAKAETPVLWPPHGKSWLIGKDCVAGRDCGQEEKGTTKDEMAGWHHGPDGHESGSWWWTGRPGVLQFMGSQRIGHGWLTALNWTEWLAHMCVISLLLQLWSTLCNPMWTVAHQVLLSMGFSRKEYWSGLPCPLPGHLPYPGTEPASLRSTALAGMFFITSSTWKVLFTCLF